MCLDKAGAMLTCSSNSLRTQRAGVYEMAYMVRPDRAFCEFPFFRSRMTAEAHTSDECRKALVDRNQSCHVGCDTCTTTCTNPGLRGIAAAWRCSAGQPLIGTFAASVASDAGQDMRTRHGAVRRQGTPPIPTSIWKEQFDVLIQNDINSPRVPRNSVSCRKAHLTDSFGAYVSPLDSLGRPQKRKGYHVPCTTSSQCHSRCGEHPILGESYVCLKNARFFSYQGSYEDGTSYYLDEPGDDAWDVKNSNLTAEWLGTCVGKSTRPADCCELVAHPCDAVWQTRGTTTSTPGARRSRARAPSTARWGAPGGWGGCRPSAGRAWSGWATTFCSPRWPTRRQAGRGQSWREGCSTGSRSRRSRVTTP